MVSPQYWCSSRDITHSATSNEKGRYVMQKRKRLCYHKLRNAETFSIFPTMSDTQTTIVLCVLFARKSCISLSNIWFRKSSLSTGVQPGGGGHLGHLSPPKFSKHCIAILTFLETFKE